MTPPARRRRPLLFLATGALIVAAAIHLAVRDQFAVLAPVTYASPWPLVLVAALGLASIHGWRRAWRAAVLCLAVLTVAAWQWTGTWGHSPSSEAPAGPECRLLFWNAARPDHASRALIDAIREERADLVALVEAGRVSDEARDAYARELPDFRVHRLPGDMLVLSRGTVTLGETRHLANRTTIHALTCDSPIGPVSLVLADLGSNPLADRKPLVRAAEEMAMFDTDAIVLGDFNTPYDSAAFDPFRRRYTHALRAAHRGPIETWPVVAPCLAIDHVWLPPALAVVSAGKRWTRASDHAMLTVTFVRR